MSSVNFFFQGRDLWLDWKGWLYLLFFFSWLRHESGPLSQCREYKDKMAINIEYKKYFPGPLHLLLIDALHFYWPGQYRWGGVGLEMKTSISFNVAISSQKATVSLLCLDSVVSPISWRKRESLICRNKVQRRLNLALLPWTLCQDSPWIGSVCLACTLDMYIIGPWSRKGF